MTTQDADCYLAVNLSPQQISQPFEVLNVKVMEVAGDNFVFYEWKDPGYTRNENI